MSREAAPEYSWGPSHPCYQSNYACSLWFSLYIGGIAIGAARNHASYKNLRGFSKLWTNTVFRRVLISRSRHYPHLLKTANCLLAYVGREASLCVNIVKTKICTGKTQCTKNKAMLATYRYVYYIIWHQRGGRTRQYCKMPQSQYGTL